MKFSRPAMLAAMVNGEREEKNTGSPAWLCKLAKRQA
jgi:hypothetical protein